MMNSMLIISGLLFIYYESLHMVAEERFIDLLIRQLLAFAVHYNSHS